MKIGLQLYLVRDKMAEDFEGTLKAVAEMGYDCVKFAGYDPCGYLKNYNGRCLVIHFKDFAKKNSRRRLLRRARQRNMA